MEASISYEYGLITLVLLVGPLLSAGTDMDPHLQHSVGWFQNTAPV